MNKDDRTAWLGIPIGTAIGAGIAFAIGDGWHAAGWMTVGLAFVLNWVAFVPAWIGRTEKFYDLLGGITFISVAMLGLWLGGSPSSLQLLVFVMVSLWALRLAGFLFLRIKKAGKDTRFDAIKQSFPRFLLAWTFQGLWVTFTLAAALVVLTHPVQPAASAWTSAGALLWLMGISIEITADVQKYRFRQIPANKGRFIRHGLWAISRHPNYFGEILLWTGMAVLAFPLLQGWQFLTLLSPVLIFVLLTRISGIPLLERHADEKWGGQADYETYKQATPVLVPFIGKTGG